MKKILGIIIIIFAIIGLGFSGVFVALRYGLLNVRGTISDRNAAIVGKGNIKQVGVLRNL
jgi:hypothetical protein